MKRLILLILFASCVSASALTKDELIRQIRQKVGLLEQELGRAQNAAASADGNVERLQGELDTAQTQVNTVGTERDGWRDYGNDQHEKFINAEKRVAEEKVKKQRWVMMFSGLALVVAVYFGLKFFTPIGRFIP